MELLKNIPIIAYHKVSDVTEIGLTTVSPIKFEQQLNIINSLGFEPITFKDIEIGGNLPAKPIIITFDDGYESVYDIALPILEKFGYKAVVYIITDFIGKHSTWEAVSFQQKYMHLSLSQIRILQKKGYEIASHGKSHKYLPIMSNKEVYSELTDSKMYLEEQIGERIISFCYPYGRSCKRVREIVGQTGYKFATQNLSLSKSSNNNPLSLQRRSIYASDTSRTFKDKIEKSLNFTFSRLSESIIQKGALASIGLVTIRENIFSHAKTPRN